MEVPNVPFDPRPLEPLIKETAKALVQELKHEKYKGEDWTKEMELENMLAFNFHGTKTEVPEREVPFYIENPYLQPYGEKMNITREKWVTDTITTVTN